MSMQSRGSVRRDEYGSRIDRRHSVILAYSNPYLSILLGSLFPIFFVATAVPLLPPLGLMMLVSWRLVRPGILPVWAGFPLGLFDDLFSGYPFGSAVMLWSLAMLAIELIEARFPWRGFLQDWFTGNFILLSYLLLATMLSGAILGLPLFKALVPQLLLTMLMFPIVSRMIALLDRLRLTRMRAP